MARNETLTRRERQVMDVVYELEEATAKEVQQRLSAAPTYSAVRAVLSRLVRQGHLKYRQSGPRYVYRAAGQKRARRSALQKVVDTFFDGSPLRTMNALLDISTDRLSKQEIQKLAKIIAKAEEQSE